MVTVRQGVQEALGEFTSSHIMTAGWNQRNPVPPSTSATFWVCSGLVWLAFSDLSVSSHPLNNYVSLICPANNAQRNQHSQIQCSTFQHTATVSTRCPIQKSQDLATFQRFPVPQSASHLNDSIPPAAWEAQGTAMQISKALFLKAEADHRDTQRIMPNHLLWKRLRWIMSKGGHTAQFQSLGTKLLTPHSTS